MLSPLVAMLLSECSGSVGKVFVMLFCLLRIESEAKRAADMVIDGSLFAVLSLLGWKTKPTVLKSET